MGGLRRGMRVGRSFLVPGFSLEFEAFRKTLAAIWPHDACQIIRLRPYNTRRILSWRPADVRAEFSAGLPLAFAHLLRGRLRGCGPGCAREERKAAHPGEAGVLPARCPALSRDLAQYLASVPFGGILHGERRLRYLGACWAHRGTSVQAGGSGWRVGFAHRIVCALPIREGLETAWEAYCHGHSWGAGDVYSATATTLIERSRGYGIVVLGLDVFQKRG